MLQDNHLRKRNYLMLSLQSHYKKCNLYFLLVKLLLAKLLLGKLVLVLVKLVLVERSHK
jgi:hypothetical protein